MFAELQCVHPRPEALSPSSDPLHLAVSQKCKHNEPSSPTKSSSLRSDFELSRPEA